MLDVSIIIVNYNTKDLLKNCISSIINNTKTVTYEIIVSDNGSTDGSLEMLRTSFPGVIIIDNKKNLGFGAANNKAKEISQGKYIFYLNSDTILQNDALYYFKSYFENNLDKKIGCLGCNLLNENNEIGFSYFKFINYKDEFKNLLKTNILLIISSMYRLFHKKKQFVIKNLGTEYFGVVDCVLGADMFMQNNELTRFDELFFMYHEEADLQYNLFIHQDLHSYIIPGPKIVHIGGGSSKCQCDFIDYMLKITTYYNVVSKIKYLRKNDNKKIKIFWVKLLSSIVFLNPYILRNHNRKIKDLWKI